MKQWIEKNWDNIVFSIEAITFSTFFLALVFGGFILVASLAG